MKIMDFLSKSAILADLKSTKKEDVIKELVDLLISAGAFDDGADDVCLAAQTIGDGIRIIHGH